MVTYKESYPIARKGHTCTGCKETINKGEQYERIEQACFNEEDIERDFRTFKHCTKCLKKMAAEQRERQAEFEEREKECRVNGHNFEDLYDVEYDSGGAAFPHNCIGTFCTNCGKEQKTIIA